MGTHVGDAGLLMDTPKKGSAWYLSRKKSVPKKMTSELRRRSCMQASIEDRQKSGSLRRGRERMHFPAALSLSATSSPLCSIADEAA